MAYHLVFYAFTHTKLIFSNFRENSAFYFSRVKQKVKEGLLCKICNCKEHKEKNHQSSIDKTPYSLFHNNKPTFLGSRNAIL